MRAIQSPSTDPRFNLALEQYIFDQMPRKRSYLMLWRNDRTIVVGKHQDTFAEINADYVRANQIQVVRRLSGGGAVYHDLGNVNFTFIADHTGSDFDFSTFCRPVIWALEEIRQIFGIDGAGKVYDFTPMNVWAWGEKIPGCQIRIAMLDWTDSLKLEVLQPVFGEIEHKRFVDEVGGGMHHTAYYVKDYPAYRDFIVGQGGEIIFESETEDEKGYRRCCYARMPGTQMIVEVLEKAWLRN